MSRTTITEESIEARPPISNFGSFVARSWRCSNAMQDIVLPMWCQANMHDTSIRWNVHSYFNCLTEEENTILVKHSCTRDKKLMVRFQTLRVNNLASMAADIRKNGHVLDGVGNHDVHSRSRGGPRCLQRFVDNLGLHNATQTTPSTPADNPRLKLRHLCDVFAAIALHCEASCELTHYIACFVASDAWVHSGVSGRSYTVDPAYSE